MTMCVSRARYSAVVVRMAEWGGRQRGREPRAALLGSIKIEPATGPRSDLSPKIVLRGGVPGL